MEGAKVIMGILCCLFSISYDPCMIGKESIDSLRKIGAIGDSAAIRKMACLATAIEMDQSEYLYWRLKRIGLEPCGAPELEYLVKPWKSSVVLISAQLGTGKIFSCKEKIKNSLGRLCRNDSLQSFRACDSFRNMKPPRIIARPPPDSNTSGR